MGLGGLPEHPVSVGRLGVVCRGDGRGLLLMLLLLMGEEECYLNTHLGTGKCGWGGQGWVLAHEDTGAGGLGVAAFAALLAICMTLLYPTMHEPWVIPGAFPCFCFPCMNHESRIMHYFFCLMLHA